MIVTRLLTPMMPIAALLSACVPVEPEANSVAQTDWRVVDYVSGLQLSVPADAAVSRLEGIDSIPMEVRGASYSLDFDNFGEFRGPANATAGGRPAVVKETRSDNCVQKLVGIELREPSPLTPPLCDQSGKNCTKPNGLAQLSARCVPGRACETVERMIASIRFVPPPYAKLPAPDVNWRPQAAVCRMPGDE